LNINDNGTLHNLDSNSICFKLCETLCALQQYRTHDLTL
jgi:hypothetical protein